MSQSQNELKKGRSFITSRTKLFERAKRYCQLHASELSTRVNLGFGVHGTVFTCRRLDFGAATALKIHERALPYQRERDVYFRLRDLQISEIEGHHVPILVDHDDDLLAIEMSIVVRPFVLDFGGAYLDIPPDYGPEVIEQWTREKEVSNYVD